MFTSIDPRPRPSILTKPARGTWVLLLAALVAGATACRGPEAAPAEPSSDSASHGAPSEAGATTRATTASQVPTDVAALLARIKASDRDHLAVSEEDGQFLRLLVAASGRRRALEIGAASGYSAIWIGLGLRDTGGRLVTIEYDPARAREAAENVRNAGLSDVVEVIAGDAFQVIPKLEGKFDCVFVDAWKRDYLKFFEMTWPRLEAGGLFLGHNVINKKSEMGDFLQRISSQSDLLTSIVAPSGEGISVSWKRSVAPGQSR
jgi:caffeoyl-CoA O-methyltransferase